MKNLVLIALFAVFALTACVVTPGPPGHGGITVSPLPAVVELDIEPFYFYNGFYYYYHDNGWSYGNRKSGPWTALPRSHWPKEVRHKARIREKVKDRDWKEHRKLEIERR